jgi:hypothetical protein
MIPGECEEGDLNPHSFRNQILSLARLPVPPSSRLISTAYMPGSALILAAEQVPCALITRVPRPPDSTCTMASSRCGSWTLHEPPVERCEHQDDSDVHHQPLPEPASEEQNIHAHDDGYQREHVKNDGRVSSHGPFLGWQSASTRPIIQTFR